MIRSIKRGQRLDSRGKPRVQVDLTTDRGTFRALVPSGASTGTNEAVEVRDKDPNIYSGKGVSLVVQNIECILTPALVVSGLNVETDLKKIDALMRKTDGTDDKSRLGANAILGVSMACARAGAASLGIPLYEYLRREASGNQKKHVMPVPGEGTMHSGNTMPFQEFMIAPVGASSMEEAVRIGAEVYQQLKKVLIDRFGPSVIAIGDEGGFAPPISHPHEALDLLVQVVEDCKYDGSVNFAIDPASSEFYQDGNYNLGFKGSGSNTRTTQQLKELYLSLLHRYPIILLEDPFAEEDCSSWADFNKECPVDLVGDGLLVTNPKYIHQATRSKTCNALLLKINQIGTITEAIEEANLAYSFGWSVFVSHRSGDTTDDFIADMVVALETGHIKSGAPCRGERVAKYNRLTDIKAKLIDGGEDHIYAGENFRVAHTLE
ncbi:hypothetical protein BDV24DRAFT_174829 [Aspergillus arachidicola]|uniref:Enolase n=1 Tax=Aspergillus arachidicola TaxID=656916 RepID=A0A5N6YBZ9_9EURO|nr:hypothetical protein BDV24DRAFT_174829 [Aspergillus arachidicola]